MNRHNRCPPYLHLSFNSCVPGFPPTVIILNNTFYISIVNTPLPFHYLFLYYHVLFLYILPILTMHFMINNIITPVVIFKLYFTLYVITCFCSWSLMISTLHAVLPCAVLCFNMLLNECLLIIHHSVLYVSTLA